MLQNCLQIKDVLLKMEGWSFITSEENKFSFSAPLEYFEGAFEGLFLEQTVVLHGGALTMNASLSNEKEVLLIITY